MDLKGKPKLSIEKQVNEFLVTKGVKFNLITKQSAIDFLTNNSYLFKIKSYTKNYSKNPSGTYIDLEFAYLVDLSTIDMYLRKFIIKLCLDIEHLLKTKLLRDFNADSSDGYEIIDDFLNENENLKSSLENSSRVAQQNMSLYTAKDNILRTYGINLSIWNFIEIIDFGSFMKFCKFYYSKYPNEQFDKIKPMLWSVKCLRNSSAHNNCLINNLNVFNNFYPNLNIKNYILNSTNLSPRSINKKLKNPFIYDFVVIILLFDEICISKKMKFQIYKKMINFFNHRIRKNDIYYKNNTLLKSSYIFVVKFLIFILKNRNNHL